MNVSDLNFKKIVAITLVTVVTLIAGNAAYAYLSVDRPVAQLLRSHPHVVSYELERPNGNSPLVTAKLTSVADLPEVSKQLRADLTELLGPCRLTIKDERSPELAAFMYEAHFVLQEAAWSGGFVAMRTRLATLAEAFEVEIQVTVGPERIYLSATMADSYAYELVERVSVPGGRAELR